MAQAKAGDAVKIHYTGKLEDGTVFDSSRDGDPLAFTLGEGRVIPGFEEAVTGMAPGEERTTRIEPEQGYGDRREDMVVELPRESLAGEVEPQVGQNLQLRLENGQLIPVVVTEVQDETVTIDANHPLAGRTLIFDLELVEIG